MSGRALVLRGDARALPLPDASVDLIVTSPPYYSLRAYTDGGEMYDGQIGAEPTPQEYIAALVDCTREWMRVLKPSGSCWVDLGDKYSGQPGGPPGSTSPVFDGRTRAEGWRTRAPRRDKGPVRNKSLMLLPERYRIACVDQLGLIARAVVVWSKPNGLPESVTDRVRRSHEDWVHLTRQPRYYSAVDEIRESYAPRYVDRVARYGGRSREDLPARHYATGDRNDSAAARGILGLNHTGSLDPLGKLPGSVWEIATEPLTVPDHLGVDHFAAFPTEWPRRIILGWSPSGICVECGEGRRPVAWRSDQPVKVWDLAPTGTDRRAGQRHGIDGSTLGLAYTRTITGEACACPEPTAPTRPSVILDPFGGTGTSALVAVSLGRIGITVDRSADYCRLAAWRTTDPGQLAKAMRVDAPPREHEDQIALFEREVVASA